MNFERRIVNGWSYFYVPEFERQGIIHGFFTGLSPERLSEGNDRTRFLDLFSLIDAVVMNQEHGVEVHRIKAGERPSSGDGIIVMERGVAGVIKTADCLPVILVEPSFPMVGIVHAGWRGAVKRIAGKAVKMMVETGANADKITALFGPAIGPCCYEVREDVSGAFIKGGFSSRVFSRRSSESVFLDLREANRETLTEAGVENIHDIGLCTHCSTECLYSYRRGDRDKRQISFVALSSGV